VFTQANGIDLVLYIHPELVDEGYVIVLHRQKYTVSQILLVEDLYNEYHELVMKYSGTWME
jgi:hypothetical protein